MINKRKSGWVVGIISFMIGLISCSDYSIPVLIGQGIEEEACVSNSKSGLISTDKLFSKLNTPDLVIVDVRSATEYSAGHIPNSINIPFEVPFSLWITMKNGLLLEVPEVTELVSALGEKGISPESKVVLVTSVPTETNPYSLAFPTRAALTLAYVGVKSIQILDGGFDKWAAEGKPVVTTETPITPVNFTCNTPADLFVDIEYVHNNLGNIILLDARDANVYSGEVVEPFANKPGHIPTALSLPAPSLWNSDGTYKSKSEIKSIVKSVVGNNKNKEIVVYCGVGGYASTVWFILTKVLHYKNVKVYDGSAQEWVQYYDMEM